MTNEQKRDLCLASMRGPTASRSSNPLLKNEQGLRALWERRRREEIESRIEDSKPLEQILESLLKHSPTFANLFRSVGRHPICSSG
jgi:hypothetical protein